jgi:hypothetical protein
MAISNRENAKIFNFGYFGAFLTGKSELALGCVGCDFPHEGC